MTLLMLLRDTWMKQEDKCYFISISYMFFAILVGVSVVDAQSGRVRCVIERWRQLPAKSAKSR
jgi:hypothetical protein